MDGAVCSLVGARVRVGGVVEEYAIKYTILWFYMCPTDAFPFASGEEEILRCITAEKILMCDDKQSGRLNASMRRGVYVLFQPIRAFSLGFEPCRSSLLPQPSTREIRTEY